MKRIGLSLAALMTGAGLASAAIAADVTVTLTGVQPKGGNVLVSLQTAGEFMKPEGHYGSIAAGDVTGDETVVVHNVPPGEYAVMVLHDADGDMQMARETDGKPKEGWGMSGQWTRGHRPTFTEVKITVPDAGTTVTVPVVYP
jgi:uncharacterized protein (DUF2141 family)